MKDFSHFPVGAVLMMGAPGSGKGTQASLITSRLQFFHFDTGAHLERLLFGLSGKGDAETEKEKENFKSGKMISPSFVLKILKSEALKIAHIGMGIVFSGSPRTMYEAFGDNRKEGLIQALEKIYGRDRIIIFSMKMPPSASVYRNSRRAICRSCRTIILPKEIIGTSLLSCPVCGGKLARRALDREDVIKKRVAVFKKETVPVIAAIKKRGIAVYEIDASPRPHIIFELIMKRLYDFFSKTKERRIS